MVLIPSVVYRCMNKADCNDALQVWNEADAEEEVLAIVVRTGLRCVTCVNHNSSICLLMDELNDYSLIN